MAISNVSPVRRRAISPKLALTIDAINANPRLREFYEQCCALRDDQLKYLLKMMRAYKRQVRTYKRRNGLSHG